MTDIISAIDSATGCHQCGNPLGSSPSSDFCSEFCQATWQAKRLNPPPVSEPVPAPSFITPVGLWTALSRHGFIAQDWQRRMFPPRFDIRGWVGEVAWEYLREGEGPPLPQPES